MPTEELTLVSSVEDEFTDELTRLSGLLDEVDEKASETFDIDMGVDGFAQTKSQLKEIKRELNDIDDTNVGLDADAWGPSPENTIFDTEKDGTFSRLSDMEIASVLDMQSGFSTHVPTNDGHVPDDGRMTADGPQGDDEDSGLSKKDMMNALQDIQPDTIDVESIMVRGQQQDAQSLMDFRELESQLDMTQIRRRLNSGDTELMQALTGFSNDDTDFSDVMDKLAGLNVVRGRRGSVLGDFKDKVNSVNVTMSDFYNILASVLPIFAVFIGAIPAAITALSALAVAAIGAAGALGAMAGLGLMGMMMTDSGLSTEQLKAEVSALASTFKTQFGPLADSFVPLLKDGFDTIKDIMRDLSDRSSFLLQMRDDARAFMAFVESNVGPFLERLARFGDAVTPILAMLGGALTGGGFFKFLSTELAQSLPILKAVGASLMQILPLIINLSQGFLILSGFILGVVGVLSQLLNMFPTLATALGVIIAGALTVAGAMFTLAAASNAATFAAAELSLTSILGSGALASLAQSALYASGSLSALRVAVAALLTTFGIGVFLWGIGELAKRFNVLGGNIRDATENLKQFGRVSGRISGVNAGFGGSPRAGGYTDYTDNSTYNYDGGSKDDQFRQQFATEYSEGQKTDKKFDGW